MSSNLFNKILYIGTGLHTEVIDHFKNTNNFVFVDSQPRTEFGYDYYYRPFYRSNFILPLFEKLKSQNFFNFQTNNTADIITFSNHYEEINKPYLDSSCLFFYDKCGKNLRSERNLKYFISTAIPNNLYDNTFLHNEIKSCNTVLVSGHHPHFKIVDYLATPLHFIGYSNTYFPKNLSSFLKEDSENENTFVAWMLENPSKILSYTHVDYETGDMKTFETYDDFYGEHNKEEKSKTKLIVNDRNIKKELRVCFR
jgi:hypothetical protein